MTESYTKSNPALEKLIAECRSSEELASVLLRHQIASGQPTKFDRVAISESANNWAEPSQSSGKDAPKNDGLQLFRRAVTVNGVTRLLEAYSISGLDFLEKEFRR